MYSQRKGRQLITESCAQVRELYLSQSKGFLTTRFDRLLPPSHIRSALEGCGREEAPGGNRERKRTTEKGTRPAKRVLSRSAGMRYGGTGRRVPLGRDAKLDANRPVLLIVPHCRTATRHTSTVIYEFVPAVHTKAIGSQLESQVGVKLVKLQCGNDTVSTVTVSSRDSDSERPPFCPTTRSCLWPG